MTAFPAAPRRLSPTGARPLTWVVTAVIVAACWLVGSLFDTSHLAYGQTVPSIDKVSTSAGTVLKRRPQLAADPTTSGLVYLVWEEGGSKSTASGINSTNLMYSWRDPGTGTWSAPGYVYGPNPDTARYTGATSVGEMHPHIQADSNGDLHVVFSVERAGGTGTAAGRSLYYTVGSDLTTGAPFWTTPMRLDYVTFPGTTGNLLNRDNQRLFVRSNPNFPTDPYPIVGYVLWTGNSGNQLRVSRVGYGPGTTVTRIDNSPLTNPVTANGGPVAVLEIDASTLQLVYAVKNTSGGGNGFWGAPLTLAGGTATWGGAPHDDLAGANGEDCSISGCTGATATRDGSANTWVVANYDVGSTHTTQWTYDGATRETGLFSTDAPKTGRQPVVVYDAGTGDRAAIYNLCTYSGTGESGCTGRDIYYRVYSAGAWSDPALVTGSTTGTQKHITAVADWATAGNVYYAWVGNGQTPDTGDHVYFSILTP